MIGMFHNIVFLWIALGVSGTTALLFAILFFRSLRAQSVDATARNTHDPFSVVEMFLVRTAAFLLLLLGLYRVVKPEVVQVLKDPSSVSAEETPPRPAKARKMVRPSNHASKPSANSQETETNRH